MSRVQELLESGVHFGHLKRKWHPKMAPYIFMERNGIHIIDLHKTDAKLNEACAALAQISKSGKKILFVATKKQAKESVEKRVKNTNMPYVTERWPGGMLTNFATIRKAVRKMGAIDKMMTEESFTALSKRERLQISRQREKLEKNLGSIADLNRLPAALFIVDIKREHIAVAEAKKLNIPTFAIVDTNSNPTLVDFPIPANDDATKSIDKIMEIVIEAVTEGLSERKVEREKIAPAKDGEEKEDDSENKAVEKKKAPAAEKVASTKKTPAGVKVASTKVAPAAKEKKASKKEEAEA
ncbi:MAG TPA: 30S ribosomal protein S2 [Flavobacteriales bacterium]|nr:30S ribosomal protein S2 [Flavobacteriales bacterium]